MIRVPLPFGLGAFAIPVTIVSPTNAAGTVQLIDNGTNVGRPVRVINGIAIGPLLGLPPGQHAVIAVFTAKNQVTFESSTSNPVNFRI